MSGDDEIELIRRGYEAWARGDLEGLFSIMAVITDQREALRRVGLDPSLADE